MKKSILVFLTTCLFPYSFFGQVQGQAQGQVLQSVTKVNASSTTNIENELVLSNQSTEIKVPLSDDISNYTHVLIVDGTINYEAINANYTPRILMTSLSCEWLAKKLSSSIFTVVNPYEFDKRRAKKEPRFLKTEKNPNYLYLYLNQSYGKGDDINSTLIIRDSNKKIIYYANHINTGINIILEPIIML